VTPGHRFYGYDRCSTCRRALAWLREHDVPVTVIDITTTPPDVALLRQALAQLGNRGRLFNTSGRSYRELGAERVRAMDDDEVLAALAADGRLIRRPFLVSGDGRISTGFKPEEWAKTLDLPPSP
jgi:arsenate reductase